MKLILKKKEDYVKGIYNTYADYLEMIRIHQIEIRHEEKLIFRAETDSMYPWILSLKDDEVIVLDNSLIKSFNWKIKKNERIYYSELIDSSSCHLIYQVNKLLLIQSDDCYTMASVISCFFENGHIQIRWKTPPLDIKQSRIVIGEKYICFPNYKLSVISGLSDIDGKLLWQFDITQFGHYYDHTFYKEPPKECKRKINKIYCYNNKVIVTLSLAIIALHPETGELLWKIEFDDRSPHDLIFNENIAYAGNGLSYIVIDIEEGKVIYKNDFSIQDTVIVGRVRWVGYNLDILRNGFLWGTMLDNGHNFLLKFDPATGEVLDSCHISIRGLSQDPIFIENTIYMRDQDGNLNIFELEE